MTIFHYIMAGLATIFGLVSWLLVRKGGIWNPTLAEDDLALNAPITEPISEMNNVPPTPVTLVLSDSGASGAKLATLENMCIAIKEMEGANPANNNPGNCRYYSGGYLAIYGKVGQTKAGFAVFSTYALGWLYLQNLIKSKIHQNPNWSLLQFFENYAPVSDGNNPTHYSQFVAKRMGVDNTFLVKNISYT